MRHKRLVYIWLAIGLLAAAAYAEVPQKPFKPLYWVEGHVYPPPVMPVVPAPGEPAPPAPESPDVAHREVLFYNNNVENAVSAITDGTGYFKLNAWDLYYNNAAEEAIVPGETYKLAVKKAADGWGANAQPVTLEVYVGFTTASITLKKGAGPVGGDLTITTSSLPNAEVGKVYHTTLSATGGTTPYSWTITKGELPHGLILDGSTIKGTPSAGTEGLWSIDVEVKDSGDPANVVKASFSLEVNPAVPANTYLLGIEVYTMAKSAPQTGGKWVKLSWAKETDAPLSVDLYCLEADPGRVPVGIYKDDPSAWTKVSPASPGWEFFTEKNYALYRKADVNEAYFKAVRINVTAPEVIQSAIASGKANLMINGGGNYTLLSLPFQQINGLELDQIFGGQLPKGDVSGATQVLGYQEGSFKNAMYLDANGQWQVVPGSSKISYSGGAGYLFNSQVGTNPDTVMTVVGRVRKGSFNTPIGTDYNVIANPFPVEQELANCDFGSSAAQAGEANAADQILEHVVTGGIDNGFSKANTLASINPDVWSPLGTQGIGKVVLGKGYLYNKQSGKAFTWGYNPYE
jgi:hypothetical protein